MFHSCREGTIPKGSANGKNKRNSRIALNVILSFCNLFLPLSIGASRKKSGAKGKLGDDEYRRREMIM